MNSTSRSILALILAVAVLGTTLAAAARAHQVTYKGTVISVEKEFVKVSVIDAKTKKPLAMTFQVDGDTKILRGDKLVKFEDARMDKNEPIAVTVDTDDLPTLAIVIRLDLKR